MRFLAVIALLLLQFSSLVEAAQHDRQSRRDDFFGEALYYSYQGDYFDAIARLDTELTQYYGLDDPKLDRLHYHINDAEFSVGDFELHYRMHRKAGRAIKAVIEGSVDPEVKNEALYRLAKIYFEKDRKLNALYTIERIKGRVPDHLEKDVTFLKGQIYMVNGRFEQAQKLFESLAGSGSYEGYAEFNLGLSELARGNKTAANKTFSALGEIHSDNREVLALKDKANLTLGSRAMDAKAYQEAALYLERVRIEGPFSDRALLGLGWAYAALGNYKQALVPWTILSKRNVTDASVQDAMLGVPYAYSKLGLYGKAALDYGQALTVMGEELQRLDASIKSIKEGKFLKALVREEIKKDKDWVIKLRQLPDEPETYYLMDLMASHDFQSSLQNYLDLDDLRKRLEQWSDYYSAYQELIQIRRNYYQPLLPHIDEQFRKLDSLIKLRLEQRDRINKRLQAMLVAPRPDYLATAQEHRAMQAIEELEKSSSNSNRATRARIERLKGYIHWNWTVDYDKRLTKTFKDLAELDNDIDRLKQIYQSFVRTRQAATQSYEGYDKQIERLSLKTERAEQTVQTLMRRQGRMIEVMATNELEKRAEKLEAEQVKARFALAESYDRATMNKLKVPKKNTEAAGKEKNSTEKKDEVKTQSENSPETGAKAGL